MQVTILGCGPSAGVPVVGCTCAVCTSGQKRNRRLRSSIVVAEGETQVLVDSAPDLREQLLVNKINRLDAVVYTHGHADHLHGLDDLRSINQLINKALPAYGDDATLAELHRRFPYVFDNAGPRHGFWYQPKLEARPIRGPFRIGALEVQPFPQSHGAMRDPTVGLRFGDFAYSTDVKNIPEEGFRALEGIQVWLVDCLSERPNPAHSDLKQTLEWIARVKPRRAILTHMNHSLDYDALLAKLPEGVEPAYDGMIIDI